MILVHLSGGLGNQMFQYALGRRLSLERKVPLVLDTGSFARDRLRDFELDQFQIAGKVASPFLARLARPWPQSWNGRKRFFRWPGLPVVKERDFPFDPVVLECPRWARLDGYWQTERYFADTADRIRADFQLREPIGSSHRDLLQRIEAANSVSVHVRRGDYVSDAATNEYHGTCSPAWYEQAMSAMAERVEKPAFFVFSDDPAWARDNLPKRWPIVFIDPQPAGREAADMHLMAACRHHIIANSSFSWWGAWLDPRSDKQVIAPQRWFNKAAKDTRDLIPPGWVRL